MRAPSAPQYSGMTDSTATLAPTPAHTTIIEPGGIEAIPSHKRHGSPWQLFATWTAPNLEFATIFVGVIAVAFFGLGFWQAMLALALGTAVGALTQGVLSAWGPREGLAQMVLSRTAFGYRGNILPAALNTVMAGLGWFAVNSVSGAFAVSALTGMPTVLALLIVVVIEVAVAFIGHDLVQIFERYASYILGAIFLVATITIFLLADLGGAVKGGGFSFGGFTLAAGAAAATIAGFNPDNPTTSFTASMPAVIRDLTLVAIAIGAIAANALNIYSGAMSFLAAGIKIRFSLRRAIVALGFGIIGFFIAWGALADAGAKYESFLLVIAYWIAPWLGVVLVDRFLRRNTEIYSIVTERANYRNAAGVSAFLIGLVVSIWLFSNQQLYVGLLATKAPVIGDLTAIVGFILAAVAYWVIFTAIKPRLGGPLGDTPDVVIGVDAADDVA